VGGWALKDRCCWEGKGNLPIHHSNENLTKVCGIKETGPQESKKGELAAGANKGMCTMLSCHARGTRTYRLGQKISNDPRVSKPGLNHRRGKPGVVWGC